MHRVALLLLSIVALSCRADDLPPPESEQSRHDKIAATVKAHADTVGCSVGFNPKSIVPYLINQRRVYLALYTADIGCSGGMAMSRPVFVVVKAGAYGKYFVDLAYSTPAQTSNLFPQDVVDIFITKGELWYKARQYDFKRDARCCPSLTEHGKVVFEDGVWSPRLIKASHP